MLAYEDIKRIHIEASSFCNSSCPVCSRNYAGGPMHSWIKSKNLTFESHKKFLEISFVNQLRSITFCGNLGDPCMNPELDQICKWLLSINPNLAIQINTNAGMQDSTFWSNLGNIFKNTKCNITFSVDGLEDTNHIYRRGVRWGTVMNSMKSFINSGGTAVWEFLVFQHNQHQTELAQQLANQLGVSKFYLKKAMGFFQQGRQQAILVLKKDATFDYFIYPPDENLFTNDVLKNVKKNCDLSQSEAYDFPKFIEPNNINLNEIYIDPDYEIKLNSSKISCQTENNKEIFISSEGQVFPCCYISSRKYASNSDNFTNSQIQILLNNLGRDTFSLHKRKLKEIISDDSFQTGFSKTWSSPDIRSGKLAICSEFCAKGVTEVKSSTSHRTRF